MISDLVLDSTVLKDVFNLKTDDELEHFSNYIRKHKSKLNDALLACITTMYNDYKAGCNKDISKLH